MQSKKCLIDIIYKNGLCITENPFGITRSWPYSYIKYFYNNFCNQLIQKNNSPKILEVNQTNKLNLKLWTLFFENPKIEDFNTDKVISKSFKISSRYDLIIIKDKNFFSQEIIINKLVSSLKSEGALVVENIGRKTMEVIEFYLKNFRKLRIEILDFRLKSFILKNCILLIRVKGENKKSFQLFYSFLNLVKFLIAELIISLVINIFKKLK